MCIQQWETDFYDQDGGDTTLDASPLRHLINSQCVIGGLAKLHAKWFLRRCRRLLPLHAQAMQRNAAGNVGQAD